MAPHACNRTTPHENLCPSSDIAHVLPVVRQLVRGVEDNRVKHAMVADVEDVVVRRTLLL